MATHCPLSPELKGLGDLLAKKLPDLYNYHRNHEVGCSSLSSLCLSISHPTTTTIIQPFTVCHNNLNPSALLRGPSGEWAIDTWNEGQISSLFLFLIIPYSYYYW